MIDYEKVSKDFDEELFKWDADALQKWINKDQKRMAIKPKVFKIKFQRDIDHRWFAVIPEWTGDHDDLEMVLGADLMLEIIGNGERQVTLKMCEDIFEDYEIKLTFLEPNSGGGVYMCNSDNIKEMKIWLCGVTEFVFGKFPEVLYCKKV